MARNQDQQQYGVTGLGYQPYIRFGSPGREAKVMATATTTPAKKGLSTDIGAGLGSITQGPTVTYQSPVNTTGYNTIQSYIDQLTKQQESARVANIQRKQDILGIFGQLESMVQPGGAFEKSALSQLATQKRSDVGSETQNLISSGLFNTTTAAGVGTKWESQVGAPSRLKLEDIQQQRLSEVIGQKAGFLERIEEPYPDMSTIAQLVMQAAQMPQPAAQTTNTWGQMPRLR
jgi:hypothetical protein